MTTVTREQRLEREAEVRSMIEHGYSIARMAHVLGITPTSMHEFL